MTDDEIRELARLDAAGTPPGWVVDPYRVIRWECGHAPPSGDYDDPGTCDREGCGASGIQGHIIVQTDSGYYPPRAADAALIAAARNALPKLLAEIARLRALLA